MRVDPDKRILKLPKRLKAVKTTLTAITEADFIASHEDVGAVNRNIDMCLGIHGVHCIIQQTISVMWEKSVFVKLHL